jgi:signal transduction histidine kinase
MARRVHGVIAFLTAAGPRRMPSAWALTVDAGIAVAAAAGALVEAYTRTRNVVTLPKSTVFYPVTVDEAGVRRLIGYAAEEHGTIVGIFKDLPQTLPPLPGPSAVGVLLIALMTLPLAARRRFPLLTACVILLSILASRYQTDWRPPVVFATAVFAAYSALVYSRFRQLAVGLVGIGAIAITMTFPNTLPNVPERYAAAYAAVATLAAGLGIRAWRQRAGDSVTRLRRAQAEHEAQTRRAVRQERARIAAELHDVVTHNVSVMVVQAGAARRVLASSPDDAEQAMLAVEGSGRTAMAELRHLLGLLCPSGAADDPALRPAPGLAGLGSLIEGVRGAGLDVRLEVSGTPRDLPPGLDLAAYRVVQEALTNVIRHAGQAATSVLLSWGPKLEITVCDDGRGTRPGAGSGRGLIGLRERLAVYGGELDAGPRPGGGWRVRATIPLEQAEESAPVPVQWVPA